MTIVPKIIIADYNPEWPRLFNSEKELLIAFLSDWNICIEHIGSTSIPGLAAKPVIDIMIGVNDLSDVNTNFIKKLASLGYSYVPEREQEMPERRYFRKSNPEGVRTYQIHVVQKKSEFWQRHLQFRDYLREHSGVAAEYEALKKELALQHTDTMEYARAKSDFVKRILSLANKRNA